MVDPEDGTEVIEEEPNGAIDFSQAEAQPDGSLCVTKTKYVQKMEKTQIKECWHQVKRILVVVHVYVVLQSNSDICVKSKNSTIR